MNLLAAKCGVRPNNPSCRQAWLALARFGFSVVLISFALSLLVLPWVQLPWWKIVRRCVSIAAAVSLWLCVTRIEKQSLLSYGLSNHREGKREILFGVLLGVSGLALMLGIGLFTGVCQIHLTPDKPKLWRTVLTFIPAAGLVSILEELVFRGFILQQLFSCSRSVAVVISSALYAIVHVKETTLTQTAVLELGGLFLLGVVLSVSVLKMGHLYFAIGLHAVLAYGARVNKLVIQFQDTSVPWLVGTS
ncbi:MAG: CPBP family intramembrane metalloprotease, partial [Nitrososphaera sp.]|nr:CPBP family intramembrane metalloprotease [Nitrososphaera sp.]